MKVETDIVIARNLSFRHLRAFTCLAHTGSFTKAADQLAMSQPTLTLNIHQLEEIVGFKLFFRTTRTVALTPSGQLLLQQVETMLNEFESAVCSIRNTSKQQKNHVNVAVLPSVAIRLLPKVTNKFSKIYPDITVELHDDNGRGVQTQVLNGMADFGIANKWEENSELEFLPLVCDRVGIVCRESHPVARIKKELNWDDLKAYSFVGMTDDTGINRMIRQFQELPESIRAPKNKVLTIATLVGLLESGENLAVLPALADPNYLNPSLVYRQVTNPVLQRELCLITSHKHILSKASQEFYNFLRLKDTETSAQFPDNLVVSCE